MLFGASSDLVHWRPFLVTAWDSQAETVSLPISQPCHLQSVTWGPTPGSWELLSTRSPLHMWLSIKGTDTPHSTCRDSRWLERISVVGELVRGQLAQDQYLLVFCTVNTVQERSWKRKLPLGVAGYAPLCQRKWECCGHLYQHSPVSRISFCCCC